MIVADYISLPRVIEILQRHSKKAEEMKLTKSTTKIEGVRSSLDPQLSVPRLARNYSCFKLTQVPRT